MASSNPAGSAATADLTAACARSTAKSVTAKVRLSELVLLSRLGVSGCGVADRSAGARAYLGPRPVWPVTRWLMGRSAGDDSGLGLLRSAARVGGSRDTFGSWPEALGSSQ